MAKVRSAIFPGAMVGSLLVAWLGLVAATHMPSPVAPSAAQSAPLQTEVITGNPAAGAPSPEQMAAAAAEPAPAAVQAPVDPTDCSQNPNLPQSISQWCGLVERYATDHGLDPALIAAVMAQESGGNPQAYSKSGAVGLLQVMPKDGISSGFMCINGPCFSDRPSIVELQDPEFNISYGTRMLAGMVSRYGDIREALVHYGPQNVGYYYADKVLAIYERYRP